MIGCYPTQPHAHVELFGVRPITNAAIDHYAQAAFAHKIGQHHLTKYARCHIATRIHHNNVAGLGVIHRMAVQL